MPNTVFDYLVNLGVGAGAAFLWCLVILAAIFFIARRSA